MPASVTAPNRRPPAALLVSLVLACAGCRFDASGAAGADDPDAQVSVDGAVSVDAPPADPPLPDGPRVCGDCDSCATGGCCVETCQNCSPSCSSPGCECTLDVSGGNRTSRPSCSGGARCTIDCSDTEECRVACSGAGTTCDIDCSRADDDCRVDCTAGAACLLDCKDADDDCEFTSCTGGGPQSCGGDLYACNRPCPP